MFFGHRSDRFQSLRNSISDLVCQWVQMAALPIMYKFSQPHWSCTLNLKIETEQLISTFSSILNLEIELECRSGHFFVSCTSSRIIDPLFWTWTLSQSIQPGYTLFYWGDKMCSYGRLKKNETQAIEYVMVGIFFSYGFEGISLYFKSSLIFNLNITH